MANHNLTNHETYDSFYASEKERAAFWASAPYRGLCIRRVLVGAFSGIALGAVSPLLAEIYQKIGIDSSIPCIAPMILMALYAFTGIFGIPGGTYPFSPTRIITKNDPVKTGGARQLCRTFILGMASVLSVPILELVLEKLAPDLTFLRFILPVVCGLFAVDGLVQMISGHGLWRLCALGYRALLNKRTEAYLAAHPGRRLYTEEELITEELALPLRRSRAWRILSVLFRTALVIAAVAVPVVLQEMRLSAEEIVSCIAFSGVCLLLQLLTEPWLPAKHDVALKRAQIRMFRCGVLTDQRGIPEIIAERENKKAKKKQTKETGKADLLQAEYDAFMLKYPDLKVIPVSEMSKNQRDKIEKSVKKRKYITVFSVCGAWVLAGAVMLIISKAVLIEGTVSNLLLALGITAFAIAFFTMIHGNIFLVALRDVSDKALLRQEFRLARKGEEFIKTDEKKPSEKKSAK